MKTRAVSSTQARQLATWDLPQTDRAGQGPHHRYSIRSHGSQGPTNLQMMLQTPLRAIASTFVPTSRPLGRARSPQHQHRFCAPTSTSRWPHRKLASSRTPNFWTCVLLLAATIPSKSAACGWASCAVNIDRQLNSWRPQLPLARACSSRTRSVAHWHLLRGKCGALCHSGCKTLRRPTVSRRAWQPSLRASVTCNGNCSLSSRGS